MSGDQHHNNLPGPSDWFMAVCFVAALWVIIWLVTGGPNVLGPH